jgi:chemotaxis response regulator CheB
MNGTRLFFGILGATVAMLSAASAQRLELPAGPNREVVFRECQACHDLSMVIASTGMTRDGWNGIIEEMISYGMSVSAEDRTKILDYLSGYLGSSSTPAPPGR